MTFGVIVSAKVARISAKVDWAAIQATECGIIICNNVAFFIKILYLQLAFSDEQKPTSRCFCAKQ
jgi:hypothetical protein